MTISDRDDADIDSQAPAKHPEERYFITALARGLDVLACFRSGDTALSNQQIAERCRLPKSTVTRIAYTLAQRGYLVQVEPGGRYALGSATLALGSSMLARMDIRQFARPLMQKLADEASATLALGVRDRLSLIYTEVARSAATLTLTLQVGSRVPLATTAMGRAYLGFAGEDERSAILRLASEADDSVVDAIRAGIARGQEDLAAYGCATSFGEWQPDVNGIAVAFRSGGGTPITVINCGGPVSSLPRDFLLDTIRPKLIALASQLEQSGFH